MFSGIVEELGQVKNLSRRGNFSLLEIRAEKIRGDIKVGDSVLVNGACLTAVENKEGILGFEVMPETLKITNLGSIRVCDYVNMERSLKVGDRLSGHFVLGHIDCLGIIRKKGYLKGNFCFEINVPTEFMHLIVPKGSVAIDGISLTVAQRRASSFEVYIIPHTLKSTTLNLKGPSDKVNVEFDILLKKQNSLA